MYWLKGHQSIVVSSPPKNHPENLHPPRPPPCLFLFHVYFAIPTDSTLKGWNNRWNTVVKSIKSQVSSLMIKCILHLRLIAQHPKGRVYKKPNNHEASHHGMPGKPVTNRGFFYFKPTSVAAGTELSWDPTLPCKSTKVAFHFTSGAHGKIMFHHPKFLKECHFARRCSFLHYLFGGFTRISR